LLYKYLGLRSEENPLTCEMTALSDTLEQGPGQATDPPSLEIFTRQTEALKQPD